MLQLRITELHKLATGINIEGGYPYRCLMRDNPFKNVIWGNIVLVLDRPLLDNILFEEIEKKIREDTSLILENLIDEINEHKMFATYLMILCYYIANGRQLLNKKKDDILHIVVHIHQDIVGMNIISRFKKYLPEMKDIDLTKIIIEYRIDDYTFISTQHNYTNTDILLSLSQCAGLHPDLKPGDFIIPNTFIPYDIKNKKIYWLSQYKIPNNIVNELNNILNSKYNKLCKEYINNNYISLNSKKLNDQANLLTKKDFYQTDVLQVTELWNPKDKNAIINIISTN